MVSMIVKSSLLVIATFAVVALSHSTFYPVKDRSICWGADIPPIYSYHFHVLFLTNDKQMKADAYALQARFAKEFNVTQACKTLYHQDEMCMFGTDFAPAGPFPTAQWAVFFTPLQYTKVVQWITTHRERKGRITTACNNWNITDPQCGWNAPSFDVIIHPNTGCEYEDHGKWNTWAGNVWQLNMAAMDTAYPFVNGAPDPFDGDGPMPPPLPPSVV